MRAFNETLDRLEAAIMEMRQFSGAVAHELRTPLAALRGEIELALRRPDIGPAERDVLASQVEEIVRAGFDAAFEAGDRVAVLLGQNLIGRKKWERK